MPPFDLAIRNARVVHGDGRVTPRADVFIRGRIIARIDVPAGHRDDDERAARQVLDARGRTLIPGLIDAHVHVETWALPVFLKYGVTTVRDLHSDGEVSFSLAAEESRSRPRLVTSGPLIDGAGSFWKNAVQVSTVGEARAAVRRQIQLGARVIKVYTRLEPALLSVIVSEARARGIPVAVHLGKTTATEAAQWTAATLAEFKQALPILQHFVGLYARLGGKVAAGTDTPQQFVVPGASLHRELELFVDSGLSPAQALATATSNAAALLGIQDEAGTLDIGKVADLVLLEADPLADIRNTRRISAVVRSGAVLVDGTTAAGTR